MTLQRDHATPRSPRGGRMGTGADRAVRAAVAIMTFWLAPLDATAQRAASSRDDVRRPSGSRPMDAVCDTDDAVRHLKARLRRVSSKALALTAERETWGVAETGIATTTHEPVTAPVHTPSARRQDAGQAQEPPARPGTVRFTLQGGVFGGLGEAAGFVLGAGVAASPPSTNLVVLGDINPFLGPYGTFLNGSVTLAYQVGSGNRVKPLLGVGMGFLNADRHFNGGPQFVVGVEGKSVFGQMRFHRRLRRGDFVTLVVFGVRR